VKLDIGCGKNKKAGFVGIDQYAMDGVDGVCDLGGARWIFRDVAGLPADCLEPEHEPFAGYQGLMLKDNVVEEVHCSHFLEHLSGLQRVYFFNELYRIMKPGAKGLFIIPHWASNRAYGDPTHAWPPVSEMSFYYLKREWRLDQGNAPHTDVKWNPNGFSCDFEVTWGYALHPLIAPRHPEAQQWMLQFYKEAAQDTHATVTKLPLPK
jgi:hypothetical protein